MHTRRVRTLDRVVVLVDKGSAVLRNFRLDKAEVHTGSRRVILMRAKKGRSCCADREDEEQV